MQHPLMVIWKVEYYFKRPMGAREQWMNIDRTVHQFSTHLPWKYPSIRIIQSSLSVIRPSGWLSDWKCQIRSQFFIVCADRPIFISTPPTLCPGVPFSLSSSRGIASSEGHSMAVQFGVSYRTIGTPIVVWFVSLSQRRYDKRSGDNNGAGYK